MRSCRSFPEHSSHPHTFSPLASSKLLPSHLCWVRTTLVACCLGQCACSEVPIVVDVSLSCPEFEYVFISAPKSVKQDWIDYNRLNGVSQIEQDRVSGRGNIYFLKSQIPFIEQSVDGSDVDMFGVLAVRLLRLRVKRRTLFCSMR